LVCTHKILPGFYRPSLGCLCLNRQVKNALVGGSFLPRLLKISLRRQCVPAGTLHFVVCPVPLMLQLLQ
jgi:hypothetical protein